MKLPGLPAAISELLNSDGFQMFTESKLGNDLFISDPERAERIHDAAEHGADGSTHSEHIEDWREYADQLRDEALRATWGAETEEEGEAAEKEVEEWHDRITAEIDSCEEWHEKNESLYQQGS